ncbi:MAG: Hg(II)-responsive transcriptional regulator [Burkholderiales bacterium]
MQGMTIGALANACGVGVETVRYYQRRGLLDEPRRPAGSVRRYGEATVRRLRFIKRSQQLGFTLDEIEKLLRLENTPDCARASKLASARLAEVEAKIADLERVRGSLRGLVKACAAGRDPRSCPIVDALVVPQAQDPNAPDTVRGRQR